MSRLLDKINSPNDVKSLGENELYRLAEELREEMITRVTANGGHLASSLGVVELTIALHRIFETPRDKILWDVGHQSYAHKILTGRRESFSSLRQYGGISGFTCRDESPHDAFTAGHASTSISAALGMAVARDHNKESTHVIAVIGDGAITGGMALEALNHAGHLGKRLIVILNDNGMSISPTVGAASKIFSRVRFDHRYYRVSEKSKNILKRSRLGGKFWEFGQRVKGSIKRMVMPTILWEEFGFAYTGPIDGHDISQIVAVLEQTKNYAHKPTLIHLVTTKGKGYLPAESDAVHFHGISPKGSIKNDGQVGALPSYSQIFGDTVLELAEQDDKVVVITAAMPDGYCLGPIQEKMPDRVFDVGICEQHAVTFAAGMAAEGLKPIVAVYSTFLQRAFDQIIHDVALQELPVIFALDRGGLVGEDGKTHQGIFDLSYLSLIPNLIVAAPGDENELRQLLYTATKSNRPFAIRYPRGTVTGVSLREEFQELPIGKGVLLKQGQDMLLVAVGASVAFSVKAAERLESMGHSVAVLNMRFIAPFDQDLLQELLIDIKKVMIIEENVAAGGLGSRVSMFIQEAGIADVELKSLAIPDEFVTHGAQSVLRSEYHLDTDGIVIEALELIRRRRTGETGAAVSGIQAK